MEANENISGWKPVQEYSSDSTSPRQYLVFQNNNLTITVSQELSLLSNSLHGPGMEVATGPPYFPFLEDPMNNESLESGARSGNLTLGLRIKDSLSFSEIDFSKAKIILSSGNTKRVLKVTRLKNYRYLNCDSLLAYPYSQRMFFKIEFDLSYDEIIKSIDEFTICFPIVKRGNENITIPTLFYQRNYRDKYYPFVLGG